MTRRTKAKPKDEPKRNPKTVTIIESPDGDRATLLARNLTKPSLQAAATIQEFADRKGETGLTIDALIAELDRQCDAANAGNLKRAEAMLTAQAHTLDGIFNALARRASVQEYLKQWDTFMRLALKAQTQCRATIETLVAIKNPAPIAFVRQANIAAGPQQVNNGIPAERNSHAREETEKKQIELSGAGNELPTDNGTSTFTGRSNPQMETVGAIDRAENTGR